MLLKLIKTQSYQSGTHCELWEVSPILGDKHLANVYLLNEHMPLDLIYLVTITWRGICLQGRYCSFQWETFEYQDEYGQIQTKSGQRMEVEVTEYLRRIQSTREEIRIEVGEPYPDLPGYPEVDRTSVAYPVIFLEDLLDPPVALTDEEMAYYMPEDD